VLDEVKKSWVKPAPKREACRNTGKCIYAGACFMQNSIECKGDQIWENKAKDVAAIVRQNIPRQA
jgi:hypothetical protein